MSEIKPYRDPKTWPNAPFCAWRFRWWPSCDAKDRILEHHTWYSGRAHHWRLWRIGFYFDTRLSSINRLWPWWPWPLPCRFGLHRWEEPWPSEEGVKVCRCGKRGYTDWRAYMNAKQVRELEEKR